MLVDKGSDVFQRKTKIAFIIGDLVLGGAEKMLYQILKNIDQKKFSPIVLSLGSSFELENDILCLNVPVFKFGLKFKGYDFLGIFRFLKMVYRLKPDIIHGWMYYGNMAAFLGKLISPKKVFLMWGIRGAAYSFKNVNKSTAFFIKLSAKLSKFVDLIIYNSETSTNQHRNLGYLPKRQVVIPNGFDCEKFKPDRRSYEDVRKELKVSNETFIVGLVTRDHPVKDHNTFIQAASIVNQKRSDVCFVLVGKKIDSLNERLRQLCEKATMRRNIFLLGKREDVARVTSAFDVAVSSSISEAFPNVIGEAMASGVPCVVTDVGDSAFLVGDTGFIVPHSKPIALAEAIVETIDMSAEERLCLGRRARERILNFFEMETCIQKYEEMYRDFSNGVKG